MEATKAFLGRQQQQGSAAATEGEQPCSRCLCTSLLLCGAGHSVCARSSSSSSSSAAQLYCTHLAIEDAGRY